MKPRLTVRSSEVGPGYYVAFGSDLGTVGFFKVHDHPTCGLTVWGLSRWRGRIGYRTLGIKLVEWLDRQQGTVQFRRDQDRTGWPLEAVVMEEMPPEMPPPAEGWQAFRDEGMLWWINRILHTFGWSIAITEEDDGSIVSVEPIRSTWLGFTDEANEEEWPKFRERR